MKIEISVKVNIKNPICTENGNLELALFGSFLTSTKSIKAESDVQMSEENDSENYPG